MPIVVVPTEMINTSAVASFFPNVLVMAIRFND